MSCSPDVITTIGIKPDSAMSHVSIVDSGDGTRETIILVIEDGRKMLGMAGTFDDLLNFVAGMLGALYSWPLTNGHSDWLGEPLPVFQEKAEANGSK